ncbi:MAG: phosphatase [Phycisphaerae bacterium]|nr:MAG: phosphatase [Phycisphaerae bacterium]
MIDALLRLFAKLMYYPSLGYHDMMCVIGGWHRWDWIDDSVLLGRIPRKREINELRHEGIGAIINMCDEFAGHTVQLEEFNIKQLRLPTIDLVCPSIENLQRGVEFIRQCADSGKKVYIHCKAGRGRAATMALCYLIAKRSVCAEDAYNEMKSARVQVDRNLFKRQPVRTFEEIVRGGHPHP